MAYSEKQKTEAKNKIVDGIANGRSLKNILDTDKDLPSRPIIYQWLNSEHKDFDEDFLNNYVRAREESADHDAEYIMEIAEGVLKGRYKSDEGRVAIQAYQWAAGKKNPKKYGDSSLLKLADNEGGKIKATAIFNYDPLQTDNGTSEDSPVKEAD